MAAPVKEEVVGRQNAISYLLVDCCRRQTLFLHLSLKPDEQTTGCLLF